MSVISSLKVSALAVGIVAVLATPVLAQNFQGAGIPWELKEGTGYVVDMQGKMMAMPMDAAKHGKMMMKGARLVPKGMMFFVSGGKLYMKPSGNFDKAGGWMFN